MRVLILGGTGLLGRQIAQCLVTSPHEAYVHGYSRGERAQHRFDALRNLEESITTIGAEVVINCIGERRPIVWDRDEPVTRALNADIPRELANCLTHRTIRQLIHVSTDYVFDGTQSPYSETSSRTPYGIYGRSKAAGEDAISGLEGATIVRVPVLYGPVEFPNECGLSAVAWTLKSGGAVLADDVCVRFPTSTGLVARRIAALIGDASAPSLVHVSNNQGLTKFGQALVLCDVLQLDRSLVSRDIPNRDGRPVNVHLISEFPCEVESFVDNVRELMPAWSDW